MFALQDDGWLLRSAIVWHKPNPMPESVRDRPTNAYEMLFLLAKQGRYFYDAEAIRQEPVKWPPNPPGRRAKAQPRNDNDIAERWNPDDHTPGAQRTERLDNTNAVAARTRTLPHTRTSFPGGASWRAPASGASAADCGAPWVRVVESKKLKPWGKSWKGTAMMTVNESFRPGAGVVNQTLGWQPTCGCNADTAPATVLDPFAGRRHHAGGSAGVGAQVCGAGPERGVPGDSQAIHQSGRPLSPCRWCST